jgi:hypothetical protein
MKSTKSAARQLSILMAIISVSLGLPQSAHPQKTASVEGEWEMVSASGVDSEQSNALRKNIGKKITIVRRGDGYEIKYWDGEMITYSGNETRIAITELTDVGGDPDRVDTGSSMPESIRQQLAGQKVPLNTSYTLSADGRFLQRMTDNLKTSWTTQTRGDERRYTDPHYEIQSNAITGTYKRVSGPASEAARGSGSPKPKAPVNNASTAFANVESRGEFYFLTKDGKMLTGAEASKVPLEEGAKVVTSSTGHVKMTLPDNTTFTVGPNSDLVIDKFVYDPANDSNPKTITAELLQGVFRWVTGKTAPKDPAQMKVILPCGETGIRGTDFEANVKRDKSGSIILYFGQLEITEKKSGYTFLLNAGEKVTFRADGSMSRPRKQ